MAGAAASTGAIPSILATLRGNPFSTAVGQKIEQATDASLASENWALNMEICDTINDTDEGPKDAVKAIKKRLHQNMGKNYTVVLYTLTVLETCVKNCGRRFHLLITQKDFISELVKLIGPKNDPPLAIQDRILSLIQSWADAFQSNSEMQGVVQVYQELKQKGIEFPMTDLDTLAPIITPQRSVLSNVSPMPQVSDRPPMEQELPSKHLPARISPSAEATAAAQSSQPRSNVTAISQEQIVKLRSELDIVNGNTKVFAEMLTDLTPGHEHPEDLQLLLDLQKTCYAMQTRIVALIDRVGVEEITSELLQANDELNNLFVRFERYEKKRQAIVASRGQAYEITAPTQPKKENADEPLIDFGEASNADLSSQMQGLDIAAGGTPSESTVVKRSLSPTEEAVDEFDMFAQSRNVSYEANKARGSSYEDNMNLDTLNQGLASFAQSKGHPNLNEEDARNLDMWLKEKPVEKDETGEATPNPEFERFLERRANYCPSPESGAVRRNVKTEKQTPEDSMFTL